MVIVAGWVRTAPGEIDRFLPAAQAMIHASRAEAGCIEYAYARDLLDADALRISERWTDEAALAAHFQTPHMAAFNQAMASLTILGASVHMYVGEHKRALIER
jgi:quinol monooxygenase YgiN